MTTAAYIIITALALAWMLQYALSFLQLRRFYRRIHQLRRLGNVWIGMEGSAWKGRKYAVLVVNKEKRIAHVEEFSGYTVWAKLKPVDGLDGRPISDLLDDDIELPVSRKLLLALRNAMKYVQHAEERAAEKAREEAEAKAEADPEPIPLESSLEKSSV
jgi:DNA-binding transcriptional regulator of glucitol operon